MFQNTLGILGAVIALGFMVTIHEFGHFLAARYFGVRVDVFSFGFGTRLFGVKRGDTDYRVSILPLGGYVRMAGDNASEERTGAPDEFLSKPRWNRVIILLAGPAMNILTAIIIFAFYFGGVSRQPAYVDKPVIVAGISAGSAAERAGIEPGDHLVAINGAQNPTWERAHYEAAFTIPGNSVPITVDRNGQVIPATVISSMDDFDMFGYPAETVTVDTVTPGSPAYRAGLKPGDRIVSFGGTPIQSWYQFTQLVKQRQDHPSEMAISRSGHPMQLVVHPLKMDPGDGIVRWSMGFTYRPEIEQSDRGVLDSVGFSLWFNERLSRQMIDLVGQLFVGKASLKEVQGPLGIVTTSGRAARAGFKSLIFVMALISLNLGVLNLLPIPILDGGHIVMLAVETTLRHDLSLKAKERFLQVGFVFILVVFAIVMYNDVLRLFQHS
jgi:regulator of sigma E protease